MSEKRLDQENVHVFKVNCMALKEPKQVFSLMAAAFSSPNDGKDHSSCIIKSDKGINWWLTRVAIAMLDEILMPDPESDSPMFVVVLDEIDYLISKGQDILYKLFEYPKLENSRLVLIGIANALDLTKRILPRLAAKNCTLVYILIF
jgi:cell division control protein 6